MSELALRRGTRPGGRRSRTRSRGRRRSLARRGGRSHEPADRRARRAARRARTASNVAVCNVGAPGGTAQTQPRSPPSAAPVADRLRRRDRRRLPDRELRRLSARHDGRLRHEGHAAGQLGTRRASLDGPLIGTGLAQAHRSASPTRATDNSGIRGAIAGRRPARRDTITRSCDFTYKVPCCNAIRPRAELPGHTARTGSTRSRSASVTLRSNPRDVIGERRNRRHPARRSTFAARAAARWS